MPRQHAEKCPLHQSTLSKNVIPNLSVVEQIAELHIYCRHGLRPVAADGAAGGGGSARTFYERDPSGCSHTMKIGVREEHEEQCMFEPTV